MLQQKVSLVGSPVVGDLEERMANCDVAFYPNCHHCIDRAWVWFGLDWKMNKRKILWKSSDEIENGTVPWSERVKNQSESDLPVRPMWAIGRRMGMEWGWKWKWFTCEAHVSNRKKNGNGVSVNAMGRQWRPQERHRKDGERTEKIHLIKIYIYDIININTNILNIS